MNTIKTDLNARKFAILRVMRMLRKRWRKHGSKIILLSTIISGCCLWGVGIGIASLAMLTVPCGIMKINTNKTLWYGRQFLFFAMGVANIALSNYA